jgi:hypothetical protein
MTSLQPLPLEAAPPASPRLVALVPCLTPVDVFPNSNTTWSVLTGPLNTFDGKCLDMPNGST